MIELVKEKLDAPTLEAAFPPNRKEDAVKYALWKLLGHPAERGSCYLSWGLDSGLGAELMMALIDKGLPEWCWAGLLGPYNDNLLLYVLAPLAAGAPAWYDDEEAKGRLCIFLAERFSLEELCREDERGKNALSYAEMIHHDRWSEGNVGRTVWIQVHRVIAQRMVQCVREFQGSLPQLIKLAQDLHYGLRGDLLLFRTRF